jgi:PAS domain S-box-containing protein
VAQRGVGESHARNACRALTSLLADSPPASPFTTANPVGEGEVSIAVSTIGLQDGIGILVAGSRRPDFPTNTETLLLKVAANQAAIWLQEARLLSEQGRAARELEQRVAERTVELSSVIDALTKEIIERGQAEEALRSSEERFRRYFELGLIGMAITSPTKECLEVNDELCRILGYERSELLQKTWAEMTHPDDLASDVAQFNRVMAREIDGYTLDKRWIRKDGQVIDSIMAAKCVRRPDGSVNYFVKLVQDLTQRKRAEEALKEAQTELAHVSRVTTIGEMTASIAHEVNQPLAAIVTNGQASLRLLSRDVPDIEGAREALESMIDDGLRASDVISRIRALMKKSAPEKALLNINETIQEVAAMVASELIKNHVFMQMKLGTALPPVMGDRVQLQQVLLNLILNASDAMKGKESKPKELLISSQKKEPDHVLVMVRDSGKGFDPESAEHIFDAFYTTKNKDGGVGLGLSISRTIIEAHGGKIWATSNEGRGATLQFTLPTEKPN